MMLQNTEGVVSVAARGGGMVPGVAGGGMPALGGPVPGVGGPMPGMGGMQQPSSGASGAFWAVSLLVGALGGALAYAIVRAL